MTSYIPRWFTGPWAVTDPSSNWAQCWLTTLIETNVQCAATQVTDIAAKITYSCRCRLSSRASACRQSSCGLQMSQCISSENVQESWIKKSRALNETPSQSYGVSLVIQHHSHHTVLPAIRHKWIHPALTPTIHAGARSTYATVHSRESKMSFPISMQQWALTTWKVAGNHIHHRKNYYSARKLILILPSHRG